MSNVQVLEREQPAVPARILTPSDMLDRALTQGASVEVLEKLMALHERWETNQARKAFDSAIAEARAKIPAIKKNKHVGFDSKNGGARTDYMHETLDEIERTVVPILSEFGLSYRFRTEQTEANKVTVACLIRHRDGHWEENALSANVDTSGNKNHIQAIGSVVTYLQRYTLKAALGLSAALADDDGNAAGGNDFIDSDEVENIHNMLAATGADKDRFLKFIGASAVETIRSKDYDRAVAALQKKAAGK